MGKIKGKFAPLTEELGEDERFINDLTDFQKLVFLLVLYTSHMTRHKAPSNPNFYRKRYGLNAPGSALAKALMHIRSIYPGIKIGLESGKEVLSFVNATTYKNEKTLEGEGDSEKEEEIEEELEGEGDASSPINPRNLLAADIFCGLTQTQRDAILRQYPEEFLITKLSHYISTAEQRKVFRMNPGTVFQWLERDYRDGKKPTEGVNLKQKIRREKLMREMQEVDLEK